MRITIINWDKYQPRKDVKAPSWFRLSHHLFEDHEFFDFSPSDLMVWIYLLCLASKKSSASVTLNVTHLEKIGRIRYKDFEIAIEKLKRNQCVLVDDTDSLQPRDELVTNAGATLHNNTLHNKTEHNTPNSRGSLRHSFDFESLYKKYPRKDGKAAGLKTCKHQIKSPEEFAALNAALDRFLKRKAGTDPQYLPYFSTFMNSWRDWLDPEAGTVVAPPAAEPEWRKKAREEEAKNEAS